MEKDRIADYQKMVQTLRTAGIRAELYLGNPKKFGKQLEYADKRGTPCVVIQGSDERAKGEVTLKDLVEGAKAAAAITDNKEWKEARPAQVSVKEADLVAEVRKILARHSANAAYFYRSSRCSADPSPVRAGIRDDMSPRDTAHLPRRRGPVGSGESGNGPKADMQATPTTQRTHRRCRCPARQLGRPLCTQIRAPLPAPRPPRPPDRLLAAAAALLVVGGPRRSRPASALPQPLAADAVRRRRAADARVGLRL